MKGVQKEDSESYLDSNADSKKYSNLYLISFHLSLDHLNVLSVIFPPKLYAELYFLHFGKDSRSFREVILHFPPIWPNLELIFGPILTISSKASFSNTSIFGPIWITFWLSWGLKFCFSLSLASSKRKP